MDVIKLIREAWGWTGIQPVAVVAENDFGNLLVRDEAHRYWRICPEELSCEVVAGTRDELDRLISDAEFETDWRMDRLVEEARQQLGPLAEGMPIAPGGTSSPRSPPP